MLAYIYVVDTPYFATTDINGKATISIPESGEYSFKIWHPRLPEGTSNPTTDKITSFSVTRSFNKTIALSHTIPSEADSDVDFDEFDDY